MACSFYCSALLLEIISIRMDRTASTALTNTGTASCLLLFTCIRTHQGGKNEKRAISQSSGCETLCWQRARQKDVTGRAAGKVGSCKSERQGGKAGGAVCGAHTSHCALTARSSVSPGTCPASPSRVQAQDNVFGGNRGQKQWDCTTAPWKVLQRNSAGFSNAALGAGTATSMLDVTVLLETD